MFKHSILNFLFQIELSLLIEFLLVKIERQIFQPYFPGKIRALKQSCFECFGDEKNEEDALAGQNG